MLPIASKAIFSVHCHNDLEWQLLILGKAIENGELARLNAILMALVKESGTLLSRQ